MAYTQAINKATQKYQKKAYEAPKIRFKKGQTDIIKKRAADLGLSFNAYIYSLIAKDFAEAGLSLEVKSDPKSEQETVSDEKNAEE